MPTLTCPHCRSTQEVDLLASGADAPLLCVACGKPLTSLFPAAGRTQRIGTAPTAGTLPAAPAPVDMPAALGPYEIKGIIGAGGMGIVYEGYDARLGRSVAVKTLKPDLAKEPAFCERFLREARAVASLSHPNVTQIYFIGEEEERPFFAMEFLEGKPLDVLLREEGKLAPARAADLIRQAAAGLKAAAARGVIHRDIKPSNLVLTKEGVIKVTDFGLAKLVVADSGLTLTGEVLGSPNYLAPEQASGAPADIRSDIYSLGATLYELITGRPPFDGPTPVSIILKHVREPVRSPRQFSPDLPAPLVTLTQRMLAKRAEDRPRDYDALIRELDRLLAPIGSPVEARTPAPAAPVQRIPPIQKGGSSSGAWVLVAVLVLGAISVWGFLRQLRHSSEATEPTQTTQASLSRPLLSGGAGGGQDDPQAAPSPSPLPPSAGDTTATRILSTSSEVMPPSLGGARHHVVDLPPRLEHLREAARANLQFVENTHEITLDGRLKVKGSVYNAGFAPAGEIRVRITLTDPSGQVISTSETPLSPPFLPSQQSGNFEVLFADPHQNISIKAELTWNS